MPLEFIYQQRKKLRTDSIFYIWDDPLLFKKGIDMIIRRCVPESEQGRIYMNVIMHHHIEDILQETKQPIKFSNQVFIGLPYSKIVLSELNFVIYPKKKELNFVINAREWEISAEDMKCPYKVSWWCSFLMCGE